ncbi:unnamed protein product [Adineta ricciae]|uniref:Uncharacterized protein n=1 Tax=Adineta ricciae TaxID=249248 RepID=A0A816FXD0_ADIRI|nr:unnamed protein product [Adineta ricciae]
MTSIRLVNLSHSDISHIHSNAFQNCEHIGEIDLSSSLISTIDIHAFDQLENVSVLNLKGNLIRSFEKSIFQPLLFTVKQINLDNNPIQCDCTIEWYLEQRSDRFKLPDVCTGPVGYECLSPTELQKSQLSCYQNGNQTKKRNLCERRENDILGKESSAYLYELNCNLFSLIIFIFANKILFLL